MIEHVSKGRMHESLDGALSAAAQERLQAHLDDCATCRNEYARLAEVVRDLATLPRSARAPEDLWLGIRERIQDEAQEGGANEAVVLALPTARLPGQGVRASGAARVVRLSVSQIAAAAATIALLSAGAMRWAMAPAEAGPEGAGNSSEVVLGGAAARAVSLEEERFSAMIGELEQILDEGRSVLAPETLVTIDEALRTVDDAIADIEAALAEDPNSDLLLRLLATHQNTKLGVLQRAVGALQTRT